MKNLCWITAFLAVLAGCAKHGNAGVLEFRDAAGAIVAIGDLQLPDPIPPPGKAFEGAWQLKSSNSSFPADATKSGKCTGNVNEQYVSIDLNPGMQDNNVLLSGSVANGSLSGKWSLATFAGAKVMGTFSVTPPTGPATAPAG